MAMGRERRSNAGNRLNRVLDEDEEDEFYQTTYGGFAEEANDNDYSSEASDSDNVDSDFDIDEHDEMKSDGEDDAPKRKKRGVLTKAYKEPKRTSSQPDSPIKKIKKEKKKKIKSPCMDRATLLALQYSPPGKKALRHSTAEKSAAQEIRQKERDDRIKMMKEIAVRKNVPGVRRLTQEELLEESKLTEEINLKSLEMYRLMELEKRKAHSTKVVYRGPLIKYQSVTMPLIEELPDDEINVDDDDGEMTTRKPLTSSEKCSRTFITFTDEKIYRSHFPNKRIRAPVKHFCPITRKPAKYFDPVTQTPYATAEAFRILREVYHKYYESEEFEKQRPSRPVSATIEIQS